MVVVNREEEESAEGKKCRVQNAECRVVREPVGDGAFDVPLECKMLLFYLLLQFCKLFGIKKLN